MQRSSLRSEGFKPHLGHPCHAGLQRKKSPHNIWHWKSPRLTLPGSQRAAGNQDSTPKGAANKRTCYKTQQKAAVWKAPELYMKDIYWLALGCVLERQKSVEMFMRNKSTAGCHFSYPVCTSWQGACGHHFRYSPSVLLNLPQHFLVDPPLEAPLQSSYHIIIPVGMMAPPQRNYHGDWHPPRGGWHTPNS